MGKFFDFFKEHDSVKNNVKVNDIPAHTNGVVVHIYPLQDYSVVEVEFFNEDGISLGTKTVNAVDLRKTSSTKSDQTSNT